MVTAITLATLGNEHQGVAAPIDKVQLAVICQKSEHNFVGVQCGIMDQFASAMGKKGHAMLLDCKTLKYLYTPLKLKEYKIILANTKKKRGLGESKYNERVTETKEGLSILQGFLPQKRQLCDFSIEEFEQLKHNIKDQIICNRVQHVIYENARVLQSFDALKRGDLPAFGKLLMEANASIRDLYEVTGFELDTMVEEAMKIDGTLGARMTGAGFGGCTVNIVREDMVQEFIETVGKSYKQKTGITPEFYVSETGDGAREIL
jgi:galactokinase